MSRPTRAVAIVYREPRPTLAVAEQARFWALPWIQTHVHRWLVVGDFALCESCPASVGPVESRDDEGGRHAE